MNALMDPLHLAAPIPSPMELADSSADMRPKSPGATQASWAAELGRLTTSIEDVRPIQELRVPRIPESIRPEAG